MSDEKRCKRLGACQSYLMAGSNHCDDPNLVLDSITSAFGMALGELLLVLGRPDELGRCLSDLHVAAQGTILSSELGRSVPASESADRR